MPRPRAPITTRDEECCPECGQRPPTRNLFPQKAMINQTDLARAVAYSPELTDGEKAMVLLLLVEMDFENCIPITQAEIARKLAVPRATVNERFTRLRQLGIVLDGGRGPGGHKRMKLSSV